jgi:hypothetical protein
MIRNKPAGCASDASGVSRSAPSWTRSRGHYLSAAPAQSGGTARRSKRPGSLPGVKRHDPTPRSSLPSMRFTILGCRFCQLRTYHPGLSCSPFTRSLQRIAGIAGTLGGPPRRSGRPVACHTLPDGTIAQRVDESRLCGAVRVPPTRPRRHTQAQPLFREQQRRYGPDQPPG